MALSFLDKQRSVAGPGYNRWLVPPAALAIQMSIGQVYAFSVFKIPLTRAIGIDHSAPGDWTFPELGWIFSFAIAFLGISAAVFGKWLEGAGPRKAMFFAACCFGGGFLIAALGVRLHQLWLIYLGYGVVGGIGMGLAYISPVGPLIQWFADRPGLATGMAIMGFGGGAMVAAPLSNWLMGVFRGPNSVGVAETFVTLGILYFCFMMFGVFTIRIPPADWKPAGYVPAAAKPGGMVTTRNVDVNTATRTPQFYLLWLVLCLNTTAGIGILEQASPMIQEMFRGIVTAAAAGGFVGLLSLFNMGGRFGWSALSDYIGRKTTYAIFFGLGAVLFVAVNFTSAAYLNSVLLFVLCCGLIISMYGGGFATMPAYIRDLFGTMHVSAIFGRVLTAWSVAGVLGPVLVNYLRDYQIGRGAPLASAYSMTLYIMAGLLVIGFFCNLMVRPVREDRYLSAAAAGPPAAAAGETVTGRPPGAVTRADEAVKGEAGRADERERAQERPSAAPPSQREPQRDRRNES